MTPAIRVRLNHYAQRHQTPVNKALHYVGIPLFLVSSLGLLAKLRAHQWMGVPPILAWQPNVAWIAIVSSGLWYLWADWRLGMPTLGLFVGCYGIGALLPIQILAILFFVAVGAHWIGHFVFEGRPPTIFSSLMAILEAPAWLVVNWTGLYR